MYLRDVESRFLPGIMYMRLWGVPSQKIIGSFFTFPVFNKRYASHKQWCQPFSAISVSDMGFNSYNIISTVPIQANETLPKNG